MFNTLKHLHELHNDLPFSSEKQKVDKVKKLAANFPDKKEYSIHIRNLKQTLSLGLVLKKKFTMSSIYEHRTKKNIVLKKLSSN